MGRRLDFSLTGLLPAPTPPAEVDVLVIGAGAAGSQAALAAAAAGATVMVVDAHTIQVPGGAAARQAGRLRWQGHHTALQLLHDAQGRVCGASGVSVPDEQAWAVHAAVVVLATGTRASGLLLATQRGARLQRHDDGHPACAVLDSDGHCGIVGLLVTGDAAVWPGTAGLPQASTAAAMLAGRRSGQAAAALAESAATLARPVPVQPPSANPAASPAARHSAAPAGGHGPRRADPLAAGAALSAILASLPETACATTLRAALARLDALAQLMLHAAPAPRGLQRLTHDTRAALSVARWTVAQRLADQLTPQLARQLPDALTAAAGNWAVSAPPRPWPAPASLRQFAR